MAVQQQAFIIITHSAQSQKLFLLVGLFNDILIKL
jgi:hypothetical protein